MAKQGDDRERSSRAVVATIEEHREEIAAGFGRALAGDKVDGLPPPGLNELLGRIADLMNERPLDPESGMELNTEKVAALLQPLVKELDAALTVVAKDRAELSTTQLAKIVSMAAHDRDFKRFVAVVEALARAAGLDKVADRLCPSAREASVLEDPPAPTPAPVVTPGGGGS